MSYKKQSIKIGKTVYGNKSLGSLIDRSFKEVVKTTAPPDVSKFFKMYDELFFDYETGVDNKKLRRNLALA